MARWLSTVLLSLSPPSFVQFRWKIRKIRYQNWKFYIFPRIVYRYCFAYFIETDMFYIIVERIFFFSPNKILIKRSHVYFVMFGGEGAINKFQSVWLEKFRTNIGGKNCGGEKILSSKKYFIPLKNSILQILLLFNSLLSPDNPSIFRK